MFEQKEQIIEQLMEQIRAHATTHSSREQARAVAEAKAAPLTSQQEQLFDEAVYRQTGCKRIAFYLPEALIEELLQLDEQGIDPHDLVIQGIESALKMARSVLTQTALPANQASPSTQPSTKREATDS